MAFLVTACSHSSTGPLSRPSRAPSSETAAGLDITLDQLMRSPAPREAAKAFVGRLLTIRLRAQRWLTEFDQSLESGDGGTELGNRPSYRKLLLARPLVERMEEKIVDIYQAAQERRTEEKAALVAVGVRDAVMEARNSLAQRVLLNDLMARMSEAISVAEGTNQAEAKLFAALEGKELVQAAQASAVEVAQLVSQLPESDPLENAVVDEAENVDTIEPETPGPQEPQPPQDQPAPRQGDGRKVFPTTGSQGNISGNEFPAGTFALTFDDGPHPTHTLKQLENLKAAGVKATFFWLAKSVSLYQPIVKTTIEAGYPVENHSWTHADLMDPKALAKWHTTWQHEIVDSTAKLTEVYGEKPKFFRCPYGSGFKEPGIRKLIVEQGMIHVKWNVDSVDWHDKNPVTVLKRVLLQMRDMKRGIVLFHDIQPHTVKVIPQLLKKTKGSIRWVTIPQIVKELNRAPR
jgi:peptidoglycan/xylan/chitin deacetylase (PgdA/CDA1 family)